MAGAKNHDYHILPASPWPLVGSLAVLVLAVGAVMYMHSVAWGGTLAILGFLGVAAVMWFWWADVIRESHSGDHTPVVQLHLRYGMVLFIASEVMFFVGWFWAYFNFALFPEPIAYVDGMVERIPDAVGAWPHEGLVVLDAFKLPLLNTFILLLSGTTITWAHHGLILGERGGDMKGLWGLLGVGENDTVKKGLWLTIVLGILFSFVQAYEYSHAPFAFGESTYSSAFYMATGFHGFHVIVGVIFLMVCLARAYKGHFTPRQHFGFEAAAWYWHFVDVVWLFLFVSIYVWGGWGAEAI